MVLVLLKAFPRRGDRSMACSGLLQAPPSRELNTVTHSLYSSPAPRRRREVERVLVVLVLELGERVVEVAVAEERVV